MFISKLVFIDPSNARYTLSFNCIVELYKIVGM